MNLHYHLLALPICAAALTAAPITHAQGSLFNKKINNALSLTQLIEFAIANDKSRIQYFAQSQAIKASGIASSTLPDPKIKLGFGGLPTDSFSFDEDPMSSISLGVMQQFERGNSLSLQQQKANLQAEGTQYKGLSRELEIANQLTQLWYELGYQKEKEQILMQQHQLMREMESYIQTNYAIGKSDAQDLLNAQITISKTEEKQQATKQAQLRMLSQMSEWVGKEWLKDPAEINANMKEKWIKLTKKIHTISDAQYYPLLLSHPLVRQADSAISASKTQVDIANEAYSPQFGIEVMYAHRQANNMRGEPASDLLSAYVTMDLPLFIDARQDKNHIAAQYQVVSAKSNKDQLLFQMNAKINALMVDKTHLEQRLERYNATLLPQIAARTKAVERGYQNNTTQFMDVINATNDELIIELEHARLMADLNIVKSNLAFWLDAFDFNVTPPHIHLAATNNTLEG